MQIWIGLRDLSLETDLLDCDVLFRLFSLPDGAVDGSACFASVWFLCYHFISLLHCRKIFYLIP